MWRFESKNVLVEAGQWNNWLWRTLVLAAAVGRQWLFQTRHFCLNFMIPDSKFWFEADEKSELKIELSGLLVLLLRCRVRGQVRGLRLGPGLGRSRWFWQRSLRRWTTSARGWSPRSPASRRRTKISASVATSSSPTFSITTVWSLTSGTLIGDSKASSNKTLSLICIPLGYTWP